MNIIKHAATIQAMRLHKKKTVVSLNNNMS